MIRYALALLLAACSATPAPCETCPTQPAQVEVTVCVDSAFTADESAAIDDACDDWTAALCGLVRLQPLAIAGDPPLPTYCDVAVLRPSGDVAYAAGQGAVSTLAPRVAYVVPETIPNGWLRTVAAHEIGHALGVSHGDGLMAARNPSTCIDRRAAVMAALQQGKRQ